MILSYLMFSINFHIQQLPKQMCTDIWELDSIYGSNVYNYNLHCLVRFFFIDIYSYFSLLVSIVFIDNALYFSVFTEHQVTF